MKMRPIALLVAVVDDARRLHLLQLGVVERLRPLLPFRLFHEEQITADDGDRDKRQRPP